MNGTFGINRAALAVAALANWALSVAWYSVFGRTWAQLADVPAEWKFEPAKVALGLFFNFLLALGLAVILKAARSVGASQGLKWALLLSVLVVLPVHSGKWTWQDKPLLLAIDFGGHLVSLAATGIILGGWRRERESHASRSA